MPIPQVCKTQHQLPQLSTNSVLGIAGRSKEYKENVYINKLRGENIFGCNFSPHLRGMWRAGPMITTTIDLRSQTWSWNKLIESHRRLFQSGTYRAQGKYILRLEILGLRQALFEDLQLERKQIIWSPYPWYIMCKREKLIQLTRSRNITNDTPSHIPVMSSAQYFAELKRIETWWSTQLLVHPLCWRYLDLARGHDNDIFVEVLFPGER